MLNKLDINQQIALISAGAALLGSLIGAAATLLGTWLTKRMQSSGKVTLHVRPVFSHSAVKHASGFYKSQSNPGIYLQIPVWVDVCNTSGIPRIVRNLNLYAYHNQKEISAFTQIQYVEGKEGKTLLGDEESYTLVIPEYSARRFRLEFMLHDKDLSPEEKEIDELILSYFDEKDQIHAFHFLPINSCWKVGPLPVKREWITMNKRCKYAR